MKVEVTFTADRMLRTVVAMEKKGLNRSLKNK